VQPLPGVQDALPQLGSGCTAHLTTSLSLHGASPLATLLPRTPVTIRMTVAAAPCPAAHARVFTPSLASQRFAYIKSVLKQKHNIHSVLDFGCGEAAFLNSALLDAEMPPLVASAGVDVSPSALARGQRLASVAVAKRRGPQWAASPPPPTLRLYEAR
jgi:SAM-dependent methyltransferase